MDQNLKTIFDFIQQNENLTADEKNTFSKAVKEVDKELTITTFKLDRTEKVKRTTAILLEETIEELEQKRKAVEEQNRELEIESTLERVRARAMAMYNSSELAEVATLLFEQLKHLGVESYSSGFNIWDKEHKNLISWMSNPSGSLNPPFEMPIRDFEQHKRIYDTWEKHESFMEDDIKGKALIRHYKFLRSFPLLDESFKIGEAAGFKIPDRQVHNIAFFSNGYLLFITLQPCEQYHTIFQRFAKVFEQTYTRFLDLKKAEAQARESQIQLALERVRARTMAMYKSSELNEVAAVLFEQIRNLGGKLWGTGFALCNVEAGQDEFWFANELGVMPPVTIPNTEDEVHRVMYQAWKEKKDYLLSEKGGEELAQHYRYLNSLPQIKAFFEPVLEAGHEFPNWQQWHAAYFSKGYLLIITVEQYPEPDILKRFAKVFEQTYTRFLDLQKAEAQAREAKIEAALEKVRSRTMAMRGSDELMDVATILFQQVKALGVPQWNCGFNIWEIGDEEFIYYPGTPDGIISQSPSRIPLNEHPVFKSFDESRKRGDELFIYEKEGEMQRGHYQYMLTLPGVGDVLQSMLDAGFEFPVFQIDHVVNFTYGNLIFITYEHFPEMHEVFKRFAKVFEQTYTRFLDLQKAEAQAREAQIEAALERVRSRTMGMHRSDELQEAAVLLFQQVVALGVPAFGTGFNIWDDDRKYATAWMGGQDRMQPPFKTSSSEDIFLRIYEAAQKGDTLFVEEQGDEALKTHYEYMNSIPVFKEIADKMASAGQSFPTFQIMHCAFFTHGYLMFISFEHVPDAYDIFKRFAKVFEQTYTRFLDLQKAETLAREAQIEAALEKVRSRSLAMKQSQELQEVISTVFVQMQNLGIKADASLINILSDESKDFYLWIGTVGQTYAQKIRIPYMKHPVFDVFYEARDRGETFMTNALSRADKDSFFEYAFKYSDLKLMPDNRKKYVMDSAGFARSFAWSKNSGITIQNYAGIPYTDQENEILKRFAHVFEQAYTRFLDVQTAEAQAKEADNRAALDRVRGEIASMRTKEDLTLITPLIWKELNTLGVPFIRCGVLIMDEGKKRIHTYLSKPNGDSLSAFELSFDSQEIGVGAVKHWKRNEIYYEYWDKNQFVSFMQNLIKSHQIENPESYQGSYAPPESLYLHLVPFKQGMLYVGNTNSLKPEEIQLVQALAQTMSVAYSRYEDFRLLEEAKNQIEKTLSELKSTQSQLIQAEKMASLGELTAGIAHEIQNPLNFVNNFSEVSKELLDEMKEELATGNLQLATELADDVIQNLEKINHHGKRADAIVKGMLQHSRTSSGVKEPTDINALADEFLRLAYHGLRAKDKTFNATLKTDFDETIGKINVIPQDLGRVILNLITNAFYAVNEKKKAQQPPGGGLYEPIVTVSTSFLPPSEGEKGAVVISVADNGNGIPQAVLDKIFQPFFTTKPSGQGTGLGLSMSYEIVTKAHNGELKVENTEGEGATFKIILPI